MEEQTLSMGGINDQQINAFIKRRSQANMRNTILQQLKWVLNAFLISMGILAVLGVLFSILAVVFPDQPYGILVIKASNIFIEILVWIWGV